jgi:thioredoxin-like negative regulator of GroEL
MEGESIVVRCPQCGAKNRIPAHRWGDKRAVCGRCKSPLPPSRLFPDRQVSISDGAFASEVLGFEGPVLVEFFSPRCGHCLRLAPVLDELASAYAGRVKFVTLNIDQNHMIASEQGVNGTPTLFFYNRGRLADRVVGALPRPELVRHLDSLTN